MFKKIGFLLALSMSGYVFAGNDQVANVSVIQINTYDQFAVVVFSPEFTHTQADCLDMKNRVVIRFAGDSVEKKEMFSTALAGAMAGKKLTMGVNGCYSGMPNAYRVDVRLQ